jgi:phage terminase large subunit-like protein
MFDLQTIIDANDSLKSNINNKSGSFYFDNSRIMAFTATSTKLDSIHNSFTLCDEIW